MYELFQLVRLLSVRRECRRSGPVEIKQCAWRENGESSLLALLFSNDYLLLRWSMMGREPVVRQLCWPSEPIVAAMCFDPTVSWLLIATQPATLYILPALALLDKEAVVNQLWKTDDCTLVPVDTSGILCTAYWWHTLDDRHIAIVCTKAGDLLFIDLLSQMTVSRVKTDIHVKEMCLVQDDGQLNTWLMMTDVTGGQWKLMLEICSQSSHFSLDSEINSLGYIDIDARSIPPHTILDGTDENGPAFTVEHLAQSQQWVTLKPQYARGRHFITAYDQKSSTLQVYDSDVWHAPLFVYKLPSGVESFILTDRVIFSLSHHKGCQLMVLSNQKAESAIETQQDFNKEAVLQTLGLPEGEHVLTFWRRTFPFYWHDKHEQLLSEAQIMDKEVSSIPITSHTVLYGCIIVTDSAVYECRPRMSPERLFLQLAIVAMEISKAEQLAISVGLDLTLLAERAGDHLLKLGHISQAISSYALSKCQHAKRIASLAHQGCLQEMLMLLKRVLQNIGSDSTASEVMGRERKLLSDILLLCYIYISAHAKSNNTQVTTSFRDFLFSSFSFCESTALDLLAEYGLVSLVLDFAMARGLVVDALECLVSHAQIPIHQSILTLLEHGFSAHVLKTAYGGMLSSLSGQSLVEILVTKPKLVLMEPIVIHQCLPDLDVPVLQSLAMSLDPSRPLVQMLLKQQAVIHQRTTSLTSLTSIMSDGSHDVQRECNFSSLSQALELFLTSVLHLCHRRGDQKYWIDMKELQEDRIVMSENFETEDRPKRQLALQFGLASCGNCHAAVVRDGELYTWGCTLHGRLGHGDFVKEGDISSPTRVPLFHMLNICVEAVACGGQHTLAITHQGVYGWGSSRFGQVGVGTRYTYYRPMLLESLLTEICVAVSCGQYHSLGLTATGRVYSWGWGVHGQLGHGSPDDQLIPCFIQHLCEEVIVQVSGGYCHSLVLSDRGEVWVFGCGYFGQLGLGNNWKQTSPVILTTLKEPVTVIGTKYFHCVAVTKSNQVFIWGCHPHNLRYSASALRRSRQMGQSYQMQDGVETFQIPSVVDTSYIHSNIVQVSCGSLHTMLLTVDGEVYVWGRNLEGQLGTGSRQDERIPKMLTRINDQHMVHLASGGEFNLALDSDLCLWVWGKNDSGQLGLTRLEIRGQMLSKCVQQPSSLVVTSDVINPMLHSAVPPVNFLSQASIFSPYYASLSASINIIRFEEEQASVREDHVYTLPQLSTGDLPYSTHAVCQVYKILGEYINTECLLLQCVDLKDWGTAAQICNLDGRHQQALYYQLMGLSEMAQQISTEKLLQLSIEVVSYHLIHYNERWVETRPSQSDGIQEGTILLLQIFQYWIQQQLPVPRLQNLLQAHLQKLAPHLAIVLFRVEQLDIMTDMLRWQSFSTFFCTSFCLKILHLLLKDKTQMTAHLYKICLAVSNNTSSGYSQISDEDDVDLPSRSISIFEEVKREQSVLVKEEKLGDPPSFLLQAETQLIPYMRLWQDIAHSINKVLLSATRILLTRNQLHQLCTPVTGESKSPNTEKDCESIVVFTCGHHLQHHALVHACTSEQFSKQLSLFARCPYSAALLQLLYSQSHYLPLSCPRCAENALSF